MGVLTMKQSELNSELRKLLRSLNPKSQRDQAPTLVMIADVPSQKPAVRQSQDPYIVLIVLDNMK
jgi:hypothetical protein